MDNVLAVALYFLIIAVSSVFLFFAKKYKKTRLIFSIFVSLAIIIPCIFFCLKYTTLHNADYGRYIIISEKLSVMNFFEYLNFEGAYKLELSFWLMSKISWVLSSGPFLMFSMYYALTVFFIIAGIISLKDLSPARSVIVYIFFLLTIVPFGISGVRSLLSLSILYFATVNLLNSRPKSFIVLAILSAFFHNLSLVASVVIFFVFRLFKRKHASWSATIAMIVIPSLVMFLLLSTLTYGNILGIIGWIPIIDKYQAYQSVLDLNQPIISISSINIYNVYRSLFMVLLFVYSFFVYYKTNKNDYHISVKTSKLLILSSATIALSSIAYASRLSYFLSPLLIMAIFDLIPENNRTSFYLNPIVILYSIIYFIVFVLIANYTGFFPFNFIWEFM